MFGRQRRCCGWVGRMVKEVGSSSSTSSSAVVVNGSGRGEGGDGSETMVAVDLDVGGICGTRRSCPRCGIVHVVSEEVLEREAEARKRGENSYRDPETGYSVFTSAFLAERKVCCGLSCRHWYVRGHQEILRTGARWDSARKHQTLSLNRKKKNFPRRECVCVLSLS